jgi:hypothetical protein
VADFAGEVIKLTNDLKALEARRGVEFIDQEILERNIAETKAKLANAKTAFLAAKKEFDAAGFRAGIVVTTGSQDPRNDRGFVQPPEPPKPLSKEAIKAAKKAAEDYDKWMQGFEEAARDRQIKVIEMRIDAEQQALKEHADWIAKNEQATQDRLYEMQAKRLKEQEELQEKTRQSYVQLGEQIGSSIGNNLENAIMTGMKFKDVVRSIIQDMIRLAIQKTIVNSLTAGFGSFFGSMFGGGRALGGPVKAGTSYLVGERGPEVFTPMQSGNITPNGGGGGNSVVVNVNVDGGTKVQDDRGAGALGSAIAAAVRSELVNQRRPGGLLA